MSLPIKLHQAFEDVLGAAAARVVTPSSTMHDVPGWDSLTFIALVTQIESAFGITLSPLDALQMQSVPGIMAVLTAHGIRFE